MDSSNRLINNRFMNVFLSPVVFLLLMASIVITSVIIFCFYFYSFYLPQKRYNKQLTEKLEQLIEQHTQLLAENAALHASSVCLNKANAAKDQYFLQIGNDLKTPLHEIIDFLQALSYRVASFKPDELKTFASQMNVSVKESLLLLENVFHWPESRSGKI